MAERMVICSAINFGAAPTYRTTLGGVLIVISFFLFSMDVLVFSFYAAKTRNRTETICSTETSQPVGSLAISIYTP